MLEERSILIEGTWYPVVLSDRREALLAARAAGRAFVGVLTEQGDQDLWLAQYVVEDAEDADERFLEQVVRRSLGLPWIIGESKRLLVREFVAEDADQMLPEPEDTEGDRVFQNRDLLEAYIKNQYGFFQYGMWAIVRKRDGKLLGKAGICGSGQPKELEDREGRGSSHPQKLDLWQAGSRILSRGPQEDTRSGSIPLELGYHLAAPYRGHGYAREACRLILRYIKEEYDCPVYARVQPDNGASVRLLEDLGFRIWNP